MCTRTGYRLAPIQNCMRFANHYYGQGMYETLLGKLFQSDVYLLLGNTTKLRTNIMVS